MKKKNDFLLKEDIAACKKILVDRGPTYEMAIRFFPKWMADRVAVLYGFVRIPDDIVDETSDKKKAAEDLAQWRQAWADAVVSTAKVHHPVLRGSSMLFAQCEMPKEYWEAFFQAMEWDLWKDRYADMEELKEYMYGSACVVGLMMLQIMPKETPYDETTKIQAMKLGYAMQLTNFLRDIAEDWNERQRIYLPEDVLDKYGIEVSDFEAKRYGENWEPMMKEMIAQCRKWYDEADAGIEKLPKKLRHAVKVSSVLYRSYLDMIEESEYKVWENQYSMSKWKKLRIALRVSFLKR